MSVEQSQTITIVFPIFSSTGANVNADSLPTGKLYVEGVADAFTIVISLVSGQTGLYTATFTTSSTLVLSDGLDLVITATVGGVTISSVVWSDRADTAVYNLPTFILNNPANLITADASGFVTFNNTIINANLVQILGTALTETAGYLAAAFKKFFNIATPTLTVGGTDQSGDSYAVVKTSTGPDAVTVTTTAASAPLGTVSVYLAQGGTNYNFGTNSSGTATGGLTSGTYQVVVAKSGYGTPVVSVASGSATWDGTNLVVSGACSIAIALTAIATPSSAAAGECKIVHTATAEDGTIKDGATYKFRPTGAVKIDMTTPDLRAINNATYQVDSVGTSANNLQVTLQQGLVVNVYRGLGNTQPQTIKVPYSVGPVTLESLLAGTLVGTDATAP